MTAKTLGQGVRHRRREQANGVGYFAMRLRADRPRWGHCLNGSLTEKAAEPWRWMADEIRPSAQRAILVAVKREA